MSDLELLTQKEVENVILNLCSNGATEDDMRVVLDWAEETRLRAILLQSVLQGIVNVGVENGEVVFSKVSLCDNPN